jgi:ribonuclease P protein component
MLPRHHRLDRRGVEGVHSSPSVYGDHVAVKVKQTTEATKVAIVIPKKVVRSSVDRHRVKRRVAHAFTALMKEGLVPKSNYSFIFFPKATTRTLPFEALKESLLSCLRKAGV